MDRHPGGREQTLRALELASLPKGSRILDMGAGAGETLRLLKELGYEAVGIDLRPGGEGVSVGDMLCTGFAEESFDGIISQCAFYCCGNAAAAFKEAARLLKKGGLLMLSDVFFAPPETLYSPAGFTLLSMEDMTEQWRRYYIEALWSGSAEYTKGHGKCGYYSLICRKD